MTSADQADRATSRQAATGRPWSRSNGLGDALVHADGGSEDAGPDVGQTHGLEVALQDAVLSERPMDGREHDRVRGQALAQVRERRAWIGVQQVIG